MTAQRPRAILVPLDGSTHALAALPVARTLANLWEATLRVIHVSEPLLPPRELLQTVGLTSEQLRGLVLDQTAGPPANEIVRLAREWRAEAIVLCAHTGTAHPHGHLGSIAEAVLRAAPCPVVIIQPERGLTPWTVRKVLLPHDGTPTSGEAIGPAADLACRAEAELDVLHVAAPDFRGTPEPGTFGGLRYMDQPQHEWPAWAEEFLARVNCLGRSPEALALRLFLGRGNPGDSIIGFAREHESDLIVVAWRGHLEAQRAATLKTVIAGAPCPLLIIRVEV